MNNLIRFSLLILQIVFFCILYLFLDDSHFSGINRLEEMIRDEVLQRRIDPIIKSTEKFENADTKIKKTAKQIQKNIKTEVLDNLTSPSLFDKFFKRLYFSFVTGTTLGYGDIFPNSVLCKTITIFQLIFTIMLFII